MSNIERLKPIYTAIAAPGSGKTETLLSKLPELISAGKHIVLALPTLVLSDEIARRASSKGITCCPIDSRSGEAVVGNLEKALIGKVSKFIICTQESIRRVRPRLLHDWILVLDELPKVVDYPDWTLNPTELERLLTFTEERDGQLWLLESKESVVREQVATYLHDVRGTDCSTLGKNGAEIFRLLLSKVDVFIDKPMPNSKRHLRAVEEFDDWWAVLSSAAQCHVLAASIKNSEFEVFAKVHGFRFEDSEFSTEWRPDSSKVTIYPVAPKAPDVQPGENDRVAWREAPD